MIISCPKCGVVQDEEKPLCSHMLGKLGALVTLARYGREHLSKIGKKGGDVIKGTRGSEFYSKIGRLGGAAMKKRGEGYYSTIGKKGGRVTRAQREEMRVRREDEIARKLLEVTRDG